MTGPCPNCRTSGTACRYCPLVPRGGDVLHVGKAASVQFAKPLLFRVIRVHDWPTYDGWAWMDGYELNSTGDAVERRSIFVQLEGLRQVNKAPDPRTRNQRAAAIPRPRTTTENTTRRHQ